MKKKGFTLAEVLITLAIIGIVAALTIPTLMTDSRYQLVSSRVSKFVSVTEDAALAYAAMNGELSRLEDIESIILYKKKGKIVSEPGRPAWNRLNYYELKDGTGMEVSMVLSGQDSRFLDSDYINPAKYGDVYAALTFDHNVSGIDNVQQSLHFVMTNKGYIFPDKTDLCVSAMFDKENNERNPWKLTKTLANGVCAAVKPKP